jgi:hypothetical protein
VLVNGFVYLEQELFQDQPIPDELANGEVDFDPRVTMNAATGGLSLPAGVVPVGVNNYFTKVNNLKWAAGTPLTTTTLPVLTNWVPGKTLTLNATAITTATDIDVSEKGTLIINGTTGAVADLTLGAFTLKANSTTQNVIVGSNGSISFTAASSTLAGNIKVKGRLIADYNAAANPVTAPIAGTVDLTEATLSATASNTKTFLFADAPYTIGTVDVTNSLILRESRGLTIRSITNTGASAASSLTIPPSVTTTVDEVLTNNTPANTLTITSTTSAQNALLEPGFVSGMAPLVLGDNLYLVPIGGFDSGRNITVAASSFITANVMADLGNTAAVQSAVLGKIRGGTVNLTAGPTITGAEPITINTVLATPTVTIDVNTTFNVAPTLSAAITINNGKNLILASEVEIARSTVLALTEGVYQAVGANVTIPATGIFAAPATLGAGLKVGASVEGIAENFIFLTSAAGAAATFTPVAATPATPVKFGKDGITIPGGTTAGTLTVSGTIVGRIVVAGEGVNITLGAGTTASGRLSLLNAALLVAADSYTAANGALPGVDYSGSGTLTASANSTNGVFIDAKTPADGAAITSATKSAP